LVRRIRRIGALAVGCLSAASAFAGPHDLATQLSKLIRNSGVTVDEDASGINIEWQCPGREWELEFCIVGSTLMYWEAIEGIRDKKIDVSGRQLTFSTRMLRSARDGKVHHISLLTASWNGTQIMSTDWARTTIDSAIDHVTWVQADQHFPTGWALGEVCNSLYNNSPRFCALAKASIWP
jgi:hypothetical protein